MLEKLANLKREISYLQDRVTDLENEAERLTEEVDTNEEIRHEADATAHQTLEWAIEDFARTKGLPPQIARDLLAIVKEHTP